MQNVGKKERDIPGSNALSLVNRGLLSKMENKNIT